MNKQTFPKQRPGAEQIGGKSPEPFEQRAREFGARLDLAILQLTRELYWQHLCATGDPEDWNKTFLAMIAARKQGLAEEKAKEKKGTLDVGEMSEAIALILGPARNKGLNSAVQNRDL